MNRISRLVLGTILATAGLWTASPALAETKISLCRDVAAKDAQKSIVQCELQSSDEVKVVGVKVTGDGRSADATYKPYSAAEVPTPVLLLLDRSVSRGEFNRLRAAAVQIVDANLKGVSFGAYGFSRDMLAIAPLGTPPATIKLALDSVNQQSITPELLKNIVEALPLLAAAPGDRKIMVVLSNGDVQDTAYSIPEISAKLKQANVTLIGIAPGSSADDITNAQSLRRLAQETYGEFLTVRRGAAARVKDLLAKGGSISFQPIATDMTIKADIDGGKPVSLAYKTALAPSPDAVAATEPEAKPIDFTRPGEVFDAFRAWLQAGTRNQLIFAGGVLALVLALLLIAKLAARRHAPDIVPDFSAATTAPDAPTAPVEVKPVFGWLEFLDGNQTREPIRSRATRIGRSSDNDIVLKNTSVHRQHAVIREDPGGGLVIVDMDTANGIKVNEEWVKSARLKQGDVIELGEVRMRFTQPHSNT
ncbi:MAG: FHA domain-containing protein [Rhodopseudomonas sp.]|nr:FHA domain-containing protein [Rhodopseudomonas sp.]